jgi:hypothetical protein
MQTCAAVVLRTLFQAAHIPELFHNRSQTKQNLPSLPGHTYQWDKIIIYVAQMQFYLFVLLGGKYKHIRGKKYNL